MAGVAPRDEHREQIIRVIDAARAAYAERGYETPSGAAADALIAGGYCPQPAGNERETSYRLDAIEAGIRDSSPGWWRPEHKRLLEELIAIARRR